MNNNRLYKIGAGIGIVIISLVAILFTTAKNRDKKIAEADESKSSVMSSTNLVEDSSLSVDINSEEFNTIENSTNNNVNNTGTSEKKSEGNSNKTAEADAKKDEKKTKTNANTSAKANESSSKNEEVKKEEEAPKDPVFKYPVKGEIIQDYAKDKLVYSDTLGEWITHTGIDIKADKTTVVTASADGCVKSIKNDPRYGLTVVIEHTNGFYSVYSNLLTAEFVSVDEKVKSGQTIGTVGNTASFEILDEPHLHFEILKNSEPVDPNMYLKN